MKFCLCFLNVLAGLNMVQGGDVHKNLLNDCEFHENWESESHILYRDVNKLKAALFTFIIPFG